VKKTAIIFLALAICTLLSCCSKTAFDDPEMQADFDAISLALEARDWDALVTDTNWYTMRNEAAVRKLVAKELENYMEEDDLTSARELLTSMPPDFVDGFEYYASPEFMSWMVNRFANDGSRFIKKAGQGGYYDTHSHELAEFTNYDELTDTEYVSKVWFSGDFALNIYTSRIRSTGELTAEHSIGLYVAGTCVYMTSDASESVNGEAILRGYVNSGTYYGYDGYILCNTGSAAINNFILADTSDGGYCNVRTRADSYSGKQHRIG